MLAELSVLQYLIWNDTSEKITSVIRDQNCATWSSIATFLPPSWNHTIESSEYWISSIFIKKWNILALKLQNLPHNVVSHFPAIWLVASNKPWNLIGYFVLVFHSHWMGKRYKLNKNNAILNKSRQIVWTITDFKMDVVKLGVSMWKYVLALEMEENTVNDKITWKNTLDHERIGYATSRQ